MKTISIVIKPRGIRTVVEDAFGKQYSIDTDYVLFDGWETMIFNYNKEAGDVTNWSHLYCDRYSCKEDAMDGHRWISEHMEEIMQSDEWDWENRVWNDEDEDEEDV